MKPWILALLLLPVAALAQKHNTLIADLPSPDGQHHVEVRQCRDSDQMMGAARQREVGVLRAGVTGRCRSAVDTLVKFHAVAPYEQMEIEWRSATELRVWHPSFASKERKAPYAGTYKSQSSVTVIFTPAGSAPLADPVTWPASAAK